MLTSLFAFVISLAVSAGLLHASVRLVGERRAAFGTAVGASLAIWVVAFVTKFIPLLGLPLLLVGWFMVIMNTYKMNFGQSLGAFFINLVLAIVAIGTTFMLFGTMLLGLLGLGAIFG